MLEKKLNVVDLGLMKYKDVLDIQETLAEARGRKEIHDTLVFVEHPATITRGIRAKDGEIRADDKELERLDIEVYNIERGGATFLHCPGQVVGYPIRLSNPENKDNYMVALQQIMIDVANDYGVVAIAHPRTAYRGCWYNHGGSFNKIGAIGVQIRPMNGNFVTMHGFAFNVNNDTSLFQKIHMCGLKTETGISLRDILGYELPVEEVKRKLLDRFANNLGYASIRRFDTVDEILVRGRLIWN